MLRTIRYLTVTALFAGALSWAETAGAGPPPKRLWATVNICDTVTHPDQMGIRASMPGNGTRQRMFMRFHAQFYNQTTKKWSEVRGIGVSDWMSAGRARVKARQLGYNFTFRTPQAGATYVLRGVVDFQWRARRRTPSGRHRTVVVRTLHANTKGDHPASGADPPNYSSGICEIR